jgi:hypothetical protein
MVYLALDRQSALEAIQSAKAGGHSVWVGTDAISDEEHHRFGSDGVNVTRFIYPLTGVETSVIEEALTTVQEHHPGEIIWVQHVAKP